MMEMMAMGWISTPEGGAFRGGKSIHQTLSNSYLLLNSIMETIVATDSWAYWLWNVMRHL